MMQRGLFISTLLFASLALNTFADSLKCDRCGRVIGGKYVEYKIDGTTIVVCLQCNKTLPHCNACKLPFHKNQLINQKGELLCQTCVADSKFCALCNHRIEGRYYKLENSPELYCARCYMATPKCAVCKKPTQRRDLDPASGACLECLKKLPRCGACGKAIVGSFFRFKHTDEVYCSDCNRTRHKCYVCGIPVGNRYWKFPDGRTICNQCNEQVVIDEQQIRRIMTEVEELVSRHLGIKAEIPYTLQITPLNNHSVTVAKAAKKGENSASPLFGSELGLFRRLNGHAEIFLLYGLPAPMLYETAAHEYAHAWQAEQCPAEQSAELREGFAQWVAAEILRIKGYTEFLEKLEERNDHPYGTGYKRFKAIHQNLGRIQLIEYAKKAVR